MTKNSAAKVLLGLLSVLLVLLGPMSGAAQAKDPHALIQGSGSSWAYGAIRQWVAGVARNGLQVVFTANGAAQGRKDYANQANDFGVSDIPFGVADSTAGPDTSQGRSFAYLPVAAGGTAFPYHVEVAGKKVRNIRLSGETIAKIFTNKITNWNDAQITRDNNNHALPSIPIIPVVHSEGAGVTNQFTTYLSRQYPSIWSACNGGSVKQTQYYPLNCGGSGYMKAQAGSDGVMNFIKSPGANGAIGMEEYSYPLGAGYPSIRLLNAAGYYTLPTQYNVAVALTRAVINEDKNSPNYLTQNLDKVYTNPDQRAYPLSSYVYAIIPTAPTDPRLGKVGTSGYSPAKRQTLADFLYYSICEGQSDIGKVGYSSLPINLVQAGFEQIGKLKTADPQVNLNQRNVSTCHNPTFIAGRPRENHLAQIAPQPPACDKAGAGPCVDPRAGAYNGSASGVSTANSGVTGTGPSAASGGGVGGVGVAGVGSGGAAAQPGTVPGASDDLGLGGTTSDGTLNAGAPVATNLPADEGSGPSLVMTLLLVLLFVLVLLVPAVLGRVLLDRRASLR